MIIAFVHNNKAFLPETEAYVQFFSKYNIRCNIINAEEVGLLHRNVEWRLMGIDFNKPREGILRIHEYTSTSIPPWRKWKNWSKSFFNAQPDFRLFLNEYVKQSFLFNDRIPFGFRDMGIPESWIHQNGVPRNTEYDFVYLGDISAFREPELLLNHFSTGKLKDRSLHIVSANYDQLQQAYSNYTNITFTGPLAHEDVNRVLLKARFALNFIVDKEPINRQTSTKFLEYVACNIPVVTTDYYWVRNFQKQFGGSYYFIDKDFSNFSWENIEAFVYKSPDLAEWTWEQQIRKSGVLRFLETQFPELQF